MASHPYISGAGNISQMVAYLRKNFPATVTSETVKKYGLAPNNESYLINALQFMGVIDQEGKRTDQGHDVFVLSDDKFPAAFEKLVRDSYKELFELFGDDAWTMTRQQLTSYFRQADKTSEAIGARQANVFIVFRNLSGHEQPADTVSPKSASKTKSAKAAPAKAKIEKVTVKKAVPIEVDTGGGGGVGDARRGMALTVRVEINLPAGGSKETYDNIFKSIRANLIDE